MAKVRFIELGKKIAHSGALKTQITDLGNQVLQKQGEIARLKALIDQSGFNPEIGARLEQTLAGVDTSLRVAEAEIARTTERLRNTEEKIRLLKKEEEAILGLKKRISVLSDEIELLKLTRSLIGEYVLYLMQVVRSRIEGEVSRIISDITGGRYEQVLLDEDFNLLIRDIDNDYPIDRFSGGEQDDIAVALRIALSRYLAELHQVHDSTLLIFDEIFGSQDEERRTNLLAALRTQESRFPQIILISHISDIQGEFSNTLMVEMGTDLSSRVQEVT
jgi:exonuclease SbcC